MNEYCKRCGNCCRGMLWRKKFSFREAIGIAKGSYNKKEIEEALIKFYKKYLQERRLPIEEIKPVKWDKNKQKIIVEVNVGRCGHLSFTEDNKAICLNYENRPNECRDYLCKKARNQILIEKMEESERSVKLLKSTFQNRGGIFA